MAQTIIPAAVPTLTVGGRVFTDLANLKILFASVTDATNKNSSFRKDGTSAGYAVTSGKTLTVLAVRLYSGAVTVGNANLGFILYSDNDVGLNSATSFTNPVFSTGTGAGSALWSQGGTVLTMPLEAALSFAVPTGKFIGWQNNGTALQTAVLFGYEA